MKFNSLSKIAMIAGLSFAAVTFAADKTAAAATSPTVKAAAAPSAAAPSAPASATTASTPAATPVATAPATAATATHATAKLHSFSGTVVSTDAIANTIVVKNTKGEETFSLAATGKISSGKKEIKLADVAKDQKVVVKYTEEGATKTASSVKISAAATKKEAKTATAAAAQ